MWSGPRTVSTALMRSFGNRQDTVVVDEPLYAFYLSRTGISHPGRDQILSSMPNDWREVLDHLTASPLPAGKSVFYGKHMTHHLLPEVDRAALAPLRHAHLTAGPLPAGKSVSYGKHMTHHLLPEVDRAALAPLRHAHLIRDPDELLASYAKVRSEPTMDDLGIRQQAEIFDAYPGPVLDSRDLLENPDGMLRALCDALSIPFDAAMLSWPPGPRDTDGVWGPSWYESVWASTGFGPYRAPAGDLPPRLTGLAQQCRPYYEHLYARRLAPAVRA